MSTSVAFAFVFTLFFGVTVQYQTHAPEGITVVKASWQKLSFRPGWDEPQDPASNVGLQDVRSNTPRDANGNPTGTLTPLPSTGVPATRPAERLEQRKNTRGTSDGDSHSDATAPGQRVEQYSYQIKVLNTGSKTIDAIDWEYLFSDNNAESSRHRFQTFRRIKPANAATLTAKSFAPPKRVVSASSDQDALRLSQVVIHCILYSDGTASWRANASDADCATLRSRAKAR